MLEKNRFRVVVCGVLFSLSGAAWAGTYTALKSKLAGADRVGVGDLKDVTVTVGRCYSQKAVTYQTRERVMVDDGTLASRRAKYAYQNVTRTQTQYRSDNVAVVVYRKGNTFELVPLFSSTGSHSSVEALQQAIDNVTAQLEGDPKLVQTFTNNGLKVLQNTEAYGYEYEVKSALLKSKDGDDERFLILSQTCSRGNCPDSYGGESPVRVCVLGVRNDVVGLSDLKLRQLEEKISSAVSKL